MIVFACNIVKPHTSLCLINAVWPLYECLMQTVFGTLVTAKSKCQQTVHWKITYMINRTFNRTFHPDKEIMCCIIPGV